MVQYDSTDPYQTLLITDPIKLYRAAKPEIKVES